MRAPFAACLAVACAMLLQAPAWAKEDGEGKTVNVRMGPSRAEEVLAHIFSASGMVYILGPGVGKIETPQVSIDGKPLDSAIEWFCDTFGLTCEAADGIYRFEIKKTSPVASTTVAADTQPAEPAVKPAMTRYEVRQALGKPDEIIASPCIGNDTWRYGAKEVVFRAARVCAVRSTRPTQVSLGAVPRRQANTEPPPDLLVLRPPLRSYTDLPDWAGCPSWRTRFPDRPVLAYPCSRGTFGRAYLPATHVVRVRIW